MKHSITLKLRNTLMASLTVISASISMAQTNVYDDIIATSPDHTSLSAAITTAGLEGALQNPSANLTVFAPDNDAFDDLASALGTDVNGLLALPNLSDILLYHVLGSTVNAAAINNGDIVSPLNTTNTLKLTKTSAGEVFANHALVEAADLPADNGVVHSVGAVMLYEETVADIAIDNGFTSLVAAVTQEELLPALTNPLSQLTVFAPSNDAFDNLATALGTDISGLLALPTLSDILLYHVLGSAELAADIDNGSIVTPLNTANSVKLTKTSADGTIYVNQAKVELGDLSSYNGVVHAIDAVILPSETVVDVAIDNGFNSLVAAVVKAELLPALTNPLAELTVFAPTDTAFNDLAADLNTDMNGILALPNLSDVLLYHVAGQTLLSGDLTAGPLTMLSTDDVVVNLSNGVSINSSTVTTPDVSADNGVVHIIDKVLLQSTSSLNENLFDDIKVYPNPTSDFISITGIDANTEVKLTDLNGRIVNEVISSSNQLTLDVQNEISGEYILTFIKDASQTAIKVFISSTK